VPVAAVPVLNPVNGHYYDFVEGGFGFAAALTDAASQVYLGASGHLVTITSASENDFIVNTFLRPASADFAWIAGSDAASEGVWRWVAGPEAGVQFAAVSLPTPPDMMSYGAVKMNRGAWSIRASISTG
jgi:hypothetical protein